jgi:alanine racemase
MDSTTDSRAWVDVDPAAVCRNLRRVKRLVGPSVAVMAVVKADAYGHGASRIATVLAQEDGVAAFGVATPAEAAALRPAIGGLPIYVLSPFLPCEADIIAVTGATSVVSDPLVVAALARAAGATGVRLSVDIELDTGMGRNGVLPADAVRLCEAITACPMLRLAGAMTHFSDAESDRDWTREQIRRFETALRDLARAGYVPRVRHACNTAGLLLHRDAWFDMVRPGLALYGLMPALPTGLQAPDFEPALALRARIALIRTLPEGASVSYGRTWTARRRASLAVLMVGYGDGYPRQLGNSGEVLIRGWRAPVVGTVCMDVMLADVTDVPEAAPGDIATLIGGDGQERIRAEDLARRIGTTEHEITTRLGPRLPRVYAEVC